MGRIDVNAPDFAERVTAVLARLGAPADVTAEVVAREARSIDEALLDDLAAAPHGSGATRLDSTRVPDWLVEALVLRALGPRHVLFLCVANSARSQLGEGIGRALAPEGVHVSSAGSEPTRVRPQAIEVMREIGIDITGHESKGMDDVRRPVDAVITLCAEESCPAWLERAWRLHWPLPDPAGAGSNAAEELEAFRAARDELRRRLGVLFAR